MTLEEIRAMAMEKLASEEEVDAFMEGFGKEIQAGFNPRAARNFSGGKGFFGNEMVQRAGIGLLASLVGAATIKGINTASRAADTKGQRAKFEMALAQVMSTNKFVKGSKPEKVKEFAETLFRFAPHVVSDPNILGMLLANSLQGEAIDVNTVKTLVELEKNYVANNANTPLVGIKT